MLRNLSRALRRVFPNCITFSQAIAFNMFVAFFPLLLLALGLLGETSLFRDALREIPEHLVLILPPGSTDVVSAYFVRTELHPWRWFALGAGATLLAGMQVMVGYIEAFRLIEGDTGRLGYFRRQLRALLLLCITIVPMLVVVTFSVFGKSMRAWIGLHIASPYASRELEIGLYVAFTFLLATGVLVVLYRIGRPDHPNYRSLIPGALVASALWWTADAIFGWYVRKMPYTTVYRGLAAAIGLLLWMLITALVVLVGAAYNAEYRESKLRRAAAEAAPVPAAEPKRAYAVSAKSRVSSSD
jgi:membrane protein